MAETACHCGQLRLTVEAAPVHVHLCTCTRCQRASGSVGGWNGWFPKDGITVHGNVSLYLIEGPDHPEAFAAFCSARDISLLDGKAHKCTLCYDRLKGGLEPACAKSCPTDSIQFGEVPLLLDRARARVDDLKQQGVPGARVYGDEQLGGTGGIGGLNAMFVLTDEPEVYNLPARPKLPQDETLPGLLSTLGAAVVLAAGLIFSFRRR